MPPPDDSDIATQIAAIRHVTKSIFLGANNVYDDVIGNHPDDALRTQIEEWWSNIKTAANFMDNHAAKSDWNDFITAGRKLALEVNRISDLGDLCKGIRECVFSGQEESDAALIYAHSLVGNTLSSKLYRLKYAVDVSSPDSQTL